MWNIVSIIAVKKETLEKVRFTRGREVRARFTQMENEEEKRFTQGGHARRPKGEQCSVRGAGGRGVLGTG